jgi:ABC-2 type transport system ATP-binding protein
LIQEEKERGAVILIATHHKEDLATLCDETLRVSRGTVTPDLTFNNTGN